MGRLAFGLHLKEEGYTDEQVGAYTRTAHNLVNLNGRSIHVCWLRLALQDERISHQMEWASVESFWDGMTRAGPWHRWVAGAAGLATCLTCCCWLGWQFQMHCRPACMCLTSAGVCKPLVPRLPSSALQPAAGLWR